MQEMIKVDYKKFKLILQHLARSGYILVEWMKEGSFIGGHVENLVLTTYTPFPTIDYTNSIKTPLYHICLQLEFNVMDGMFDNDNIQSQDTTINNSPVSVTAEQ